LIFSSIKPHTFYIFSQICICWIYANFITLQFKPYGIDEKEAKSNSLTQNKIKKKEKKEG